jgi:hypothetical protein
MQQAFSPEEVLALILLLIIRSYVPSRREEKSRDGGLSISHRAGIHTGVEIFSAPGYGGAQLVRIGMVKSDLFFLRLSGGHKTFPIAPKC